jgi:hypothetical protein
MRAKIIHVLVGVGFAALPGVLLGGLFALSGLPKAGLVAGAIVFLIGLDVLFRGTDA